MIRFSYNEFCDYKNNLDKAYKEIMILKEGGKVDPKGPFYNLTLNDLGFDIIDKYDKNCNFKYYDERPIDKDLWTDEDIFTNISFRLFKGNQLSNRKFKFHDKEECKSYLLYIVEHATDEEEKNKLKKLLEDNFDSLIEKEENSVEDCMKEYIRLKECADHTLIRAKEENERIIKTYKENEALIKLIESMNEEDYMKL